MHLLHLCGTLTQNLIQDTVQQTFKVYLSSFVHRLHHFQLFLDFQWQLTNLQHLTFILHILKRIDDLCWTFHDHPLSYKLFLSLCVLKIYLLHQRPLCVLCDTQ